MSAAILRKPRKLSAQEVGRLVRAYHSGTSTMKELGKRFGVTRHTIRRYVSEHAKHI
jgi:transposase-like protein